MDEVFYKNRLEPDERGLLVVTDEYVSIHETRCFHFCVLKSFRPYLHNGETLLQAARRRKALKRIDKRRSRIAFKTKKEALDHLRFLKRRQLEHMKRNAAFINKFLECEDLEKYGPMQLVPDSNGLVSEFCVFD